MGLLSWKEQATGTPEDSPSSCGSNSSIRQRESESWGYDRIQAALANVGYHISDQTVGNVLKQHGIEPAPDRKRQTTWKTFIKSHWDVLGHRSTSRPLKSGRKAAWSRTTCCSSWNVATRRVHFAGCTPNPDEVMDEADRQEPYRLASTAFSTASDTCSWTAIASSALPFETS